MKKYDYTKSNLSNKYQLVTERYFEEITKDKLKEGMWDEELNHPIAKCIKEDGSLKDECRKMNLVANEETGTGPGLVAGGEESMPGYAGAANTVSEESEHKQLLMQHLANAKECTGHIMANGMLDEETHPKMEAVMETLHHLEELVKECGF